MSFLMWDINIDSFTRLDDETKQFTEERTTLQQTIEMTNGLVADQERQVQQLKEEVRITVALLIRPLHTLLI